MTWEGKRKEEGVRETEIERNKEDSKGGKEFSVTRWIDFLFKLWQ